MTKTEIDKAFKKAKQDNLLKQMGVLANTFCAMFDECVECPFNFYSTCPQNAISLESKMVRDLPFYEELPIDLDDECDHCIKPSKWGCCNSTECKENFPLGECCADNLEDNVGKLCFDNNLPSKLAKDIIGLIKKERERNESLYVHREYFQDK